MLFFLLYFQDLRTDESTIRELQKMKQSPVSTDEGQQVATKVQAFQYLECSAKGKKNVRAVFECATRAALSDKKKKKGPCVLL